MAAPKKNMKKEKADEAKEVTVEQEVVEQVVSEPVEEAPKVTVEQTHVVEEHDAIKCARAFAAKGFSPVGVFKKVAAMNEDVAKSSPDQKIFKSHELVMEHIKKVVA